MLAFVWIYGVVNRGDWHDRIGYGIELPVVLVVYLVLAFFLARWWALLLPVATILVALPAGRNVHLDGDLEFVFFDPLYALPSAALGAAIGVLAGKAWLRRQAGGDP